MNIFDGDNDELTNSATNTNSKDPQSSDKLGTSNTNEEAVAADGDATANDYNDYTSYDDDAEECPFEEELKKLTPEDLISIIKSKAKSKSMAE